MAGTSQQVFCAVGEVLPDQDAAQSSLRLLFTQSLACGKESINIWTLNKLKWVLTVADNFNCSPLLGGDFPASLWSQDHVAAALTGPGVCPFRPGPSLLPTCISPQSRSFCWWRQMGIKVQNTWESEKQEGLKGPMLVPSTGFGGVLQVSPGVSSDYSNNNAFTTVSVLLPPRECHIVGEPFSL